MSYAIVGFGKIAPGALGSGCIAVAGCIGVAGCNGVASKH